MLWDTPSINSSNIKISGVFSKFESRICREFCYNRILKRKLLRTFKKKIIKQSFYIVTYCFTYTGMYIFQ